MQVTAENGFFFDFLRPWTMNVGKVTEVGATVLPSFAKVYSTTGSYFELEGSGFYFNYQAQVVAGSVTKVTYFSVDGKKLAEVTGRVDAAQAFQIAKQDDGGAKLLQFVTSGADTWNLSTGNDTIVDNAGADTVNGGGGFDTVVFGGAKGNFNIEKGADGAIRVTNSSGVTDILRDVERVQFSDGVLAFDIAGNAGQAYRLYQAAFERTPDSEGLSYWTGRLDAGNTTLSAIADSFLNSPEFISKFGTEATVSNAKFVELLYTHTLGREYDQGGYDYWVGKLSAGETNRRDLLSFFSESNENQAKVADAVNDGIWLI